uniref:Methyltransferase type 11 domain-containing protein n=1 Tax=viral metagenome TaxID=1070528 RepID=A0A6C0JHK1_9ZZZZ
MNSLFTILLSNNPNLFFLKLVLLLGIILAFILIYKITAPPTSNEGFTQLEPFVLKRGQDAFDEFYTEIYDELYDVPLRSQNELVQVLKNTEPSTRESVFLDVGSGTGYVVNQLVEAGYEAYGIDKSKAMVDFSEQKYPDAEYKCGDVIDSMAFDSGKFTHILCTNFTFYLMKDQRTFLQNCYFWLKPNAYLILHLVDYDKFNIYCPNAKAPLANFPTLNKPNRLIDTMAQFYDYRYNASYRFPTGQSLGPKEVLYEETFTDNETKHVRQNEYTLYMDTIDSVLEIATKIGFMVKGKMNMAKVQKSKNRNQIANPYADENQYLYILERPM